MKYPKLTLQNLIILSITLFLLFLFFWRMDMLKVLRFDRESLIAQTSSLTPYIHALSAHPENTLYFKTKLTYPDGSVAKYRRFKNQVIGHGKVFPDKGFTNSLGEIIFVYQAPSDVLLTEQAENTVVIESGAFSSSKVTKTNLNLIPIPIILVHGYRDYDFSFNNLETYLSEKKISVFKRQYDSTLGIESASKNLSEFVDSIQKELFFQGTKVNRFSIIAHSYGGLVARYYTSTESYAVEKNTIHKIIFLAVPHKGTPFAHLGKSVYDDIAIEELSPQSSLFTTVFPSSFNQGLHTEIQIGNIAVQYDEVVPNESSLLDEWQIPTTLFNVGEDKRTLDNIMSGEFYNDANHHAILNNKSVFEKIYEMLTTNQALPQKIE